MLLANLWYMEDFLTKPPLLGSSHLIARACSQREVLKSKVSVFPVGKCSDLYIKQQSQSTSLQPLFLLLSSHSCRAISQREAHQELSEQKIQQEKKETSFLMPVFLQNCSITPSLSLPLGPFLLPFLFEPALLTHSVFRTDTILNHLA